MSVRRYDQSALRSPIRDANGWLRFDAYLTRTGVFEYLNADGSMRRELRLPEHVFSSQSLASFQMVPLTNDHPDVPLDASNTSQFQRGHMGSDVRQDGDYVRASGLISDAALVKMVEEGKSELSCGYDCDLDTVPGLWKGIKYDAVQREIRGNHVAVVDRGRAGPTARIRVDSADAIMVRQDKGDTAMEEIEIGEQTFQVPAEVAAKIRAMLLEAKIAPSATAPTDATSSIAAKADAAAARALLAKAEGERDALQKKLDAFTGKEAEEKRKTDAATDRSKIEKSVRERIDLEDLAVEILGDEFKIDARLTNRQIHEAVIKSHLPDLKLDGKDDVYVTARFDSIIEERDSEDVEPAVNKLRRDLEGDSDAEDRAERVSKARKPRADDTKLDEHGRRDRMMEESRNAHTQPVAFGISKGAK